MVSIINCDLDFLFRVHLFNLSNSLQKKNSSLKIFGRSNFPEFWQNFILGKNIHFDMLGI